MLPCAKMFVLRETSERAESWYVGQPSIGLGIDLYFEESRLRARLGTALLPEVDGWG